MSCFPRRRVGYWWSEKKSRKIIVKELAEVFRASDLELVKLDLDRPFEDQGPFAAIVHKLSDVVAKARSGDVESKAICESFQKYMDTHPNVVVIDPLPNIHKVIDRYGQYKIVDESEISDAGDIIIPPFVELTSKNISENLLKIKNGGVDFPMVCKPSMAHGSTRSHKMCIVFNEEGLKDIEPPCVVQKFINHNAVLYKMFIMGNEYFVIERPSIKNFFASDRQTIYFDSNEVSKPNSSCELTELDDNESYTPAVWPEKDKIDFIVQVLHERVGLNLFGIDVVIDNKTGQYGIIDINVFPGYSEADNFYIMLTNLVLEKIRLKESGQTETHPKPTLIDYLSTPVLNVTPAETRKTSFDNFKSRQSKSLSLCLCCPISEACCNSLTQSSKVVGDCAANEHCDGSVCLVSSNQLIPQDDSGVETSDSCDEKKNKICQKTAKHQHSKIHASDVNEQV